MKSPRTPAAVPAPQEITLSPAEIRLVMAFRNVQGEGAAMVLRMCEAIAVRYPHRTVPTLRMISGGVV